MNCFRCNYENPNDANFCRHCGCQIKEITILDRYPKLKPSSINKLRNRFFPFMYILLPLSITIFPLIVAYYLYKKSKIVDADIKKISDYFVTSGLFSKYVFIVKDKKFGLYNRKTKKEMVPCEHNMLVWKEKGKILLGADSDGNQYYIDIYNNRI